MTNGATTAEQVPQARTERIPQQAGRPRPTGPEAFTRWVEQRCAADPGVRAALRRGAGKGLNQVPSMHRFVARWLPTDASEDVQRAYYTVAAMIAVQRRSQYTPVGAAETDRAADSTANPQSGAAAEAPGSTETQDAYRQTTRRPARWSLGRSFAEAVKSTAMRESSAETRLNLLARQSMDGLHRHLPGAVRQLREAGVRVDWPALLTDLCRWHRYGGEVKRHWLQDFYRAMAQEQLRDAMNADDTAADALEQ